jgi:alpha-ketoglutarate-dependent taurine dioxygenase
LHNELSYAQAFPSKLLFYCEVPADSGGETPIADCRRILARIPPDILRRFEALGLTYVRNFAPGLGVSWQAAFDVQSADELASFLQTSGATAQWFPGGRLRVTQFRPAVRRHLSTGDLVWFNHAAFFHPSSLDPDIRATLLGGLAAEDLPFNVLYGDGTLIPDTVLEIVRQCYSAERRSFRWQRSDILLLDNTLIAHGRAAFSGARRVLVAMGDMCTSRNA